MKRVIWKALRIAALPFIVWCGCAYFGVAIWWELTKWEWQRTW